MAQATANTLQTINAGQNAIFTSTFITPQEYGIILPNANDNAIYLRGLPIRSRLCGCCMRDFFSEFYASFSANIAIPTGGTVEAISIALTVDGDPIPASTMIVTPAAVEEFQNISTQIFVPIPKGSLGSLAVENISTQAIELQNANLTVFMPSNR